MLLCCEHEDGKDEDRGGKCFGEEALGAVYVFTQFVPRENRMRAKMRMVVIKNLRNQQRLGRQSSYQCSGDHSSHKLDAFVRSI